MMAAERAGGQGQEESFAARLLRQVADMHGKERHRLEICHVTQLVVVN